METVLNRASKIDKNDLLMSFQNRLLILFIKETWFLDGIIKQFLYRLIGITYAA